MRRKWSALLMTALILSSGGYVAVEVLIHQTNSPLFNSQGNMQGGFVISLNEIGNYSQYSNSFWDNISIATYAGNISSQNSTFNATEIGQLEDRNITVLYTINNNSASTELNEAASAGFQGVLLNGNITDYSSAGLNRILNETSRMKGFIVVNYSLEGYISQESKVNLFFLNENNYTSWLEFIHSPFFNANFTENLWVNIENVSSFLLPSALRTFSALNVQYTSIGFGKLSMPAFSNVLSIVAGTSNPDKSLPSSWYIPASSFSKHFQISNGNIYTDVITTEQQNLSVEIIGINISYGYISYISSNVSFSGIPQARLLSNYLLNIIGEKLYFSFFYMYENSYFATYYIKTAVFDLSNSSNFQVRESVYNYSSTLGTMWVISQDYILISNYPINVPGDLNPSFCIINVVTQQVTNFTVKSGISQGHVTDVVLSFVNHDGNLVYIKSVVTGFFQTNLTSFKVTKYMVLDTDTDTFLPPILYSIPYYDVVTSGKNVYFPEICSTGNTTVRVFNITTGVETSLFSLNLSGINELNLVNGNFIIYSGANATMFSLEGREVWSSPLPGISPPGYGYVSSPMAGGNNTLILFSVINTESTSFINYSQSIEVIDINNGTITSHYYNNFTLNPVGSPPSLPPSPEVYHPISCSGGYLMYYTIFGSLYLFGWKV